MHFKSRYFILITMLLIYPSAISAQIESVFNGIKFHETIVSVQKKINEISETSKIITIKKPSFPLAMYTEEHLICTNINTRNGIIEKMVLTFSDNKLTYIEARGNAIHSLTGKRKDTARNYLQFKVYPSDKLICDPKKDIVWLLTEEALHPNLFAWENPYLTTNSDKKPNYYSSGKIPDYIKMGGQLGELQPIFKAKSKMLNIEQLDGSDPNAQIQLNCFGIEYAGFPRKIEARFGNNKLNTVWILTSKGEEHRIRKKLTQEYGIAIYSNEAWDVFNDWQVFLRKDKPEVLILTKDLGQEYKNKYIKP